MSLPLLMLPPRRAAAADEDAHDADIVATIAFHKAQLLMLDDSALAMMSMSFSPRRYQRSTMLPPSRQRGPRQTSQFDTPPLTV